MLLVAVACKPLPSESAPRGLYVDLRKHVELQESTDWVVDGLEYEEMAPQASRSLCSAPKAAREELTLWLDTERSRHGSTARAVFEQEGDTGRFRELRRLERVQGLEAYLEENVADACPYWLPPDPSFAGLEGDAERLVLFGESRGGGALVFGGGEVALGGGGTGRLLVGHGLGSRYTLALGLEVGAAASLVTTDGGGRTLEGNFAGAVPLLLRIHNVSRFVDLELAATTVWAGSEARMPPGVRATVGYGISTLRVADFSPYVVLWSGYEFLPPSHHTHPTNHAIWLGTRFGVDWDP